MKKELAYLALRYTPHKIDIARPYSILEYLGDKVIQLVTKGKITHTELAFPNGDGTYLCYSSVFGEVTRYEDLEKEARGEKVTKKSGVRKANLTLSSDDFYLLPMLVDRDKVEAFYQETKDQLYDVRGAVGTTLKTMQSKDRAFCNEFVIDAVQGKVEILPGVFDYQGWRDTPSGTASTLSSFIEAGREYEKGVSNGHA